VYNHLNRQKILYWR